jgi:tetratricopeptide (TPR) repeat protein
MVLAAEQPAPLYDDLETIVVAIRREYRCTPPALSSDVQYALGRSGDSTFLGLERFLYDEAYQNDRPGAFCAWLERIRNEATAALGPNARFLLVLDGLDELPPPNETVEGGSIVNLLPSAERLPERVFLLLTSRGHTPDRPLDTCPTAVYTALEKAYAASPQTLCTRYDLDPRTNTDYRAVLRTFFEQRLAPHYPQESQRAELFKQVLERGEHRFKSLSYYTALLTSGAIGPTDLATVSAEPLQQHLSALETWEPPRKFALIRRILLELAAAEQAHRAEIALMEPTPVIDRAWLGLDLLELASRVGYPATRPRELDPRFLTALYSIQELIRSYRGAAATTSRFALGLKGMLEQLATLEGWDTVDTLVRLADEALNDYRTANDETTETAALIRAGGPVAAWVASGWRLPCWDTVKDIFWICGSRAEKYQKQARTVEALRLSITALSLAELATHPDEPEQRQGELINHTASVLMVRGDIRRARGELADALADGGQAIDLREDLRQRLGAEWPPAWANDLAKVYLNRGITRSDGNDLSGALTDYGQAIGLMEGLRQRLGAEWPPAWANDLAGAYLNRGNARRDGNDLSGALADYGQAIDLREDLRQRLEPIGEWPPAWANDLAAAHMNRGNARRDGNDLSGALADYGQAIDLREGLRQRLGAEWPPAWANDLATAYLNRGNVRSDGNDLSGALTDYGQAIDWMEGLRQRLGAEWPPAWANGLAKAYLNRGVTCRDGNDLSGALADVGQAIDLREGLRQRLGAEWPPAWANDLANAYMNRGVTRSDGNDLSGVLADYGQAIDLREGLRQRLGAEWPPAWANDLANAYMNRGVTRSDGNDLSGVLADYGQAIDLREGLRQRLGAEWPPAWANDLAKVYLNRGTAKEKAEQLGDAIQDWMKAAEIYRQRVENGDLGKGADLLKAMLWIIVGHKDRADWPATAQSVLGFMRLLQPLEAIWAEQQGDTEPPWREIVGQFADTVHSLNPDQRAALLKALGENAEAVKQAFRWT